MKTQILMVNGILSSGPVIVYGDGICRWCYWMNWIGHNFNMYLHCIFTVALKFELWHVWISISRNTFIVCVLLEYVYLFLNWFVENYYGRAIQLKKLIFSFKQPTKQKIHSHWMVFYVKWGTFSYNYCLPVAAMYVSLFSSLGMFSQ